MTLDILDIELTTKAKTRYFILGYLISINSFIILSIHIKEKTSGLFKNILQIEKILKNLLFLLVFSRSSHD